MRFLMLALFCMAICHPAQAQQNENPVQQNDAPIEITASKAVEWQRTQKQYIARENVVATQGSMTIKADLLTADYRESADGKTEIYRLTAQGNVQIMDEKNTAYGDQAVYEVPDGIATLTGQNLRLVSPEQTVTAKERMEYHAKTREAKAIGGAKVVKGTDILTADTISAFFKENTTQAQAPATTQNAMGGSSLDRLEASGNVVITTPSEVLSGSKAIYKSETNTATLSGKVKVKRDQNTLEGERAEVNLTTSVSKMFGSDKAGGRVRGVFFPAQQNNPDNKGQDNKPAAISAPSQAPAPLKPALPVQNTPSAPASAGAMVPPSN